MTDATPAITGTTSCYPLVGHPVEQVRTPPAINAYFVKAGIDAVMFPVDIEPQAIESFFLMLGRWDNCRGCSVTVPHKQAAFRAMNHVTERARLAGAVNIIRREAGGSLHGDMTDGAAFVLGLAGRGIAVADRTVLLVGAAGGAGGAIAQALCEEGVGALHLVDLQKDEVDRLADRLQGFFPDCRVDRGPRNFSLVDLAINATPMGMRPDDPLPFPVERLRPDAAVADVVTKPVMTPVLQKAEDSNRAFSTGHDMADSQLELQMRFLGLWQTGQACNA